MQPRKSSDKKRKADDCYVYYEDKILIDKKSRNSEIRFIRQATFLQENDDPNQSLRTSKMSLKLRSLEKTRKFTSKIKVF